MTRPLRITKGTGAAIVALGVDRKAAEPMHAQLVRQVRQFILAGRLRSGSRMPSSRVLAQEIGVSRATVAFAYDQLASEGYLEGRQGSGMYVCPSVPDLALKIARTAAPKAHAMAGASRPALPPPYRPFQIGATDQTLFPHGTWSRLLAKSWRHPAAALTGVPDSFGWWPLRAAIAHHLGEWRGIACTAEQVVITGGTADAADLIGHCAFVPGSRVFVEEPGYAAFRIGLLKQGLDVQPVPVDEDGFNLGAAPLAGTAKGAVVTPSRQFPLGATLPLARRLSLLEWVGKAGGYIVEDDFDSEYRYDGAPLPALMSLDRGGRVIYTGSFSKILLPTLRLGFVVLPALLIEAFKPYLRARGVMAALTAQPALAEFIGSGDLAVHIRRTRRVYARRHAAMMSASPDLDGLLEMSPSTAGMHVIADLAPRLASRMSDRSAAAIAEAAGVIVSPLADYCALRPQRRALVLGFAGFPEPDLKRAMGHLGAALREA